MALSRRFLYPVTMTARRRIDIRGVETLSHGPGRSAIPYRDGIALQDARVAALRAGEGREALFFLEHEPVLTIGRKSRREHILASGARLREAGIEVCECDRGGDVTYHGPGQLVCYPVIDLAPDRKDLGRYLRDLEETAIRTLADLGLEGRRVAGLTGVWVGDEKIAAIGVRVTGWITSHGLALNVAPDLDHFQTIVPCGIRERGVTSIERITGVAPPLAEVAALMSRHFLEIFQRDTGVPPGIPAGVMEVPCRGD